MFLDYLKTIQITYTATQGERLPYRSHFIMKWKNPTNPGNMSIHEIFRDAVKLRATMAYAYQGQGFAYIHKKGHDKDQSICNCVLSPPRRMPTIESYPWNTGAVVIVIVNEMVEFATSGKIFNSGENGNKKNGKISNGERNGEYSRSTSFAKSLAHFVVVFEDFAYRHWRMSCTRRVG